MQQRLLVSAVVLASGLRSQYLTQPIGGPMRTLAVSSTGSILTANGKAVFEVRDNTLVEIAANATLVAAGPSDSIAVAAIKSTTGDTDIQITLISSGKSITIGGHGNDTPTRAAAGRDGSFYILCNTESLDFPVTNNSRARGGIDGFLVKLDADLNTLYATYLGGASTDDFQDLTVDASGSAFVAASSNSAELAPGARGAGAFLNTFGIFESAGSESFRATVAAWLAPNDNTLFAATAGQGLFRSNDQGQTWIPLNQGLSDLNITTLAGDAQTIYAGTPRALFRSLNGGTSWSETAVSASGSGIRALASVPRDRNIVYAALRTGCGLFRSADAGRTWQSRLSSDVCVSALAVNDTAVYAFTANGDVYTATTTDLQLRRISVINGVVAAVLNGSILYAATNTGLSKSVDNGVTWSEVFRGANITAVGVNNNRLFLGTADQGVLAASDNAGFTRIDEASLQQPVRSLIATAGFIAVGTDYRPDLYVAKVSPRGDQIVFASFVGGLGVESNARVALDSTGNVVIAATTDSSDLVATFEAVQRRFAGGLTDIFLSKLTPNFELISLTYLGGSGQDTLGGIAIDSRNFVYLTGTTASSDLPTSTNASRRDLNGSASAAFVAVLSPNLGSLAHLTYAARDDVATATGEAIAVTNNDVWIAGGFGAEEGFVARFTGLVSFGMITSVRNGASLVAGPIAPTSTVLIDGAGFGNSVFGLTVRMGTSEASVVRVSDTRIEVTAPADLEPGTSVPVTVTSRTGLFQGSAAVAAISPGIFSANRDGKGVAQAFLLRRDSDDVTTLTPIYECADEGACIAVPVDLGDEGDQLSLLIRATGIRNRRGLDSVTVDMNGVLAEVLSVEPVDSFSGVDQVIVTLPRSLGDAGGKIREVTIRVTVDGQAANPVTMLIG